MVRPCGLHVPRYETKSRTPLAFMSVKQSAGALLWRSARISSATQRQTPGHKIGPRIRLGFPPWRRLLFSRPGRAVSFSAAAHSTGRASSRAGTADDSSGRSLLRQRVRLLLGVPVAKAAPNDIPTMFPRLVNRRSWGLLTLSRNPRRRWLSGCSAFLMAFRIFLQSSAGWYPCFLERRAVQQHAAGRTLALLGQGGGRVLLHNFPARLVRERLEVDSAHRRAGC